MDINQLYYFLQDTAELLFITFTATIKSVFHKLNVHAGTVVVGIVIVTMCKILFRLLMNTSII